jgi:hypothetical protein
MLNIVLHATAICGEPGCQRALSTVDRTLTIPEISLVPVLDGLLCGCHNRRAVDLLQIPWKAGLPWKPNANESSRFCAMFSILR